MLMCSFAPRLAKNILQIHALKQNILGAPILMFSSTESTYLWKKTKFVFLYPKRKCPNP